MTNAAVASFTDFGAGMSLDRAVARYQPPSLVEKKQTRKYDIGPILVLIVVVGVITLAGIGGAIYICAGKGGWSMDVSGPLGFRVTIKCGKNM